MKPESKLSRSFAWLNVTQFLGALNDNVFKLLVIFFLIGQQGPEKADTISAIAGIVFAVPFILFSASAGFLADWFSKRDVLVWVKALEIVVTGFGVWAFFSGHGWLAYVALFLLSTQATLFSPSKYGIIPELVHRDEISRANSWLVALTFLAVVLGSALGPFIEERSRGHVGHASWLCVLLAAAGFLAALPIARTPAGIVRARPSLLFFRDAYRTLRDVRGDRFLLLAIFGGAYFNFAGAFMQLNLIPFGMEHVQNPWASGALLSKTQSGYLFIAAAFGIGAGSLLAGRLSGRNIEFGVVPLGALGLSLCGLALWFLKAHLGGVVALILLAGLSCGFFIVPIESFVQWRSPRHKLGEIVAANAFLNCTGWLLAAVVLFVMNTVLKLSPAACFLIMGALTLALTALTLKVLPDFLVRFIAMLVTRIMYRIRTVGLSNLPDEGGALLVSNHVTLMDAAQVLATQQRRIRFIMRREIYDTHPLRRLFPLMGVIPISHNDPPKKIVESLRAARQALDDGYLVCIFAEGALTHTGATHEFKSGFERILRGSTHPVIPVYLGGTWGSIYSHYHDRRQVRKTLRWPFPMTVIFGEPLPSDVKAWQVRRAVMELGTRWFEEKKAGPRNLGAEFIRRARQSWKTHAMADTTGRRLTYGQTLLASLVLARRLERLAGDQRNIGLLLPTSCGGALANLAVTLLGRTAVNLNFTVARESFDFALREAGLRTIVTSRAFLEKMPAFAGLPGAVMLEDLCANVSTAEKLRALIDARLSPAEAVGRQPDASPDDPACIIFSSGTTGEPKGVMLSHHNLLSNAEGIGMVLCPRQTDNLMAPLPLFHSFGYTAGIWLPLLSGIAVTYHTSPLDGAAIASAVRENACTIFFSTPTFLLAYLRRAAPEDFRSLRLVITGAEKLKARVADAFQEKFGLRPMEGYGATELSPVVSLNLPDANFGKEPQIAHREGSIGRAIPGVAIKIVDPDTGAELPPATPGLMLVKGPNVMTGYLNRPEKTAEVLRDGWYVTGDIAQVDESGFITITDRLSRFSKIGGEMVPHLAIEDEYLKGLHRTDAVLAVTSIPDEKRGERLVVLHTADAGDPAALHAVIEKSPIPNLWKPGRDAYILVDKLPVTGTGKLDIKGLRHLAQAAKAAPAGDPTP